MEDGVDGRKPRTWHPENWYGRQFAQFVGLGVKRHPDGPTKRQITDPPNDKELTQGRELEAQPKGLWKPESRLMRALNSCFRGKSSKAFI